MLKKGLPDTWDYQWTFTCVANGGLTVLPNRNLIDNVGFGEDATHTKGPAINTAINEGVDPNNHPTFLLRDLDADRFTFDNHFGGMWYRFPRSVFRLPKSVAGKVLRSIKAFFI